MGELKLTLKVAYPMILGQVGQVSMGVTDSIMVGHLGAVPLAASAFVQNVVHIPLVFLIGISSCISVKVSQAYGASQSSAIPHYFYNGFLLSLFWSFIVVLGLLLTRGHLDLLGQPAEVVAVSGPFFVCFSISLIGSIIYMCAKSFCDAFSNTMPGTVVLIFGLLLNIFLNWVFIYGNLGSPALGLTGSGYATLAARLLMAIIMVGYVFKAPIYSGYLKGFLKIKANIRIIREMAAVGVPSGLQYLFEVGAFAGAGIMMGWISTEVLAAHQIAINLASITFMFALGLSLASSVRVGQAKGRNDHAAIRRIGYSSLIFVGIIETFFALLFFFTKETLPQIYVDDVVVIRLASELLLIACLFQWFDGIQATSLGLLRGLSDVQIPTLITFLSYWLIGVPLAYLLAFRFGFDQVGIWIGLLVALGFAAGFLTWRFAQKVRVG